MAPSISIRDHIRWLPNTASEPTSTVVTTSAENRFVDIRILRQQSEDEEKGADGILHLKSLDWAFAGTSSSQMRHPQGGPILHTIWTHWIDSRTQDHPEDNVRDEGDMCVMPDGRTLEKGSMVNPDTGERTAYEEMWRDVELVATGSDKGVVNAVLVLDNHGEQARGMVVRAGQYCQGILRVRDSITLERWRWEKEGGWKREVRMGDYWLPCGAVLDGWQRLKVGGVVEYSDFEWRVLELEGDTVP